MVEIMDNYVIIGVIFILVLGILQLISINIRLRLDVKNINDRYVKLEEQYYLVTKK